MNVDKVKPYLVKRQHTFVGKTSIYFDSVDDLPNLLVTDCSGTSTIVAAQITYNQITFTA